GASRKAAGRASGLGFEDHIDLAAGLQYFPGALEAGRDDEAVAGAHRPGIAVLIADHRHALQNLAVLVFGVVDGPLAYRAFPDARVELAAGAAIVVAHTLFGIALDDLFGGGTIVFRCGCGAGEVDDLINAHGDFPVVVRARVRGSLCLIKHTTQGACLATVKNIENAGCSGLVWPEPGPAIGLTE